MLVILFYLAIEALLFWKLFEKAGQPGWASLIPIYNAYILVKISGKPAWWLILLLIPVVDVIFGIWLCNMISKSFGKDEGFTVGLVLLGFIFFPILGFGGARYLGPYGDPEAWKAAQNPQFDFEKPQAQI
jgi:Family of unknown function (DUF5684)